jgi:ATP-dependent protease ClpP protease subunit
MAKNELILYGSVGYSWWEEDFFTAKTVRRELAGMSGDITVRINSGGGIASEGQAIYTALVDYPGKVTVIVDSVAASAASLIAMAGDEILIRRGAWMLIHDPATPWTMGRGTEEDHRKEADLLAVIANAYADIYAHRTGSSREEARQIMTEQTYLDGPMAVDLGFATAVEDDEAVAAATFDYRIYAHAPQELRTRASRTLGRAPEPVAVMAMFAGHPRPLKPKLEASMAEQQATTAVETAAQTHETTAAVQTASGETTVATAAAPEVLANAVAAATMRARRITDAVAAARLPATMASDLIGEASLTVEMAIDRITAAWKEKGDVDTPMHGRETARITRDEGNTRRTGMAEALVAQMSRKAPEDDRARPFMDMSLVSMAAAVAGHKGPLRTAADREDVIRMAMHSTGDFPAILENALNKRLAAGYALAAPTFRRVATEMTFADFRPHPVSMLSDFPTLVPVSEGGEIKYGTLSDKKEMVAIVPYARAMTLTRQLLVNDDLGAIDRMVRNYGVSVAAFEDATFWAMALGGAGNNGPTMVETGRQMFNTNAADNTLASAGAAINVTSLSAGRAALRKRKRLDATDLDVTAAILLVGPDKETEAQQVVAPIQAQQAGNVNPFSGTLSVVTTAKITGNAWYLFADPNLLANFAYGYLDGAAGPRFRMDEPFGRQGISLSVELDFGCGAVDWRGGWKNPGA